MIRNLNNAEKGKIVSCVILNYNDVETTLKLINGIKGYESIDHIVVVDNHSTDNSFKLLKMENSEHIHVVQTDRNGGYGFGNNHGIKYSKDNLKADYVVIANPDVEFEDECIKQLKETLDAEEGCAITSAIPYMPDGRMQYYFAWMLQPIYKFILCTSSTFYKLMSPIYISEAKLKECKLIATDCVGGAMLMIKTSIIPASKLYDEDIFLFCEETVVGFIMKNSGLKTIVRSDLAYIHQHSVTIDKSYKTKLTKRKMQFKSQMVVLKKYYKCNSLQLLFAKLFFSFCTLEAWCADVLSCKK